MKKTVLNTIVFYLLLTNNIASQNLVPNSGFEMHSSCPNGWGEIGLLQATNWNGFDSPDYFSSCATNSQFSVPQNIFGYQQAYSDSSYVGILCLVPTTNPVSSEFIQVQLTDSLVKSHYYCVSFYVSLADSSNYAIANVGAYFSDTAVSLLALGDSIITPQIQNPNDSILNDKINWRLVSGYYYAAGGENFLTIGNFHTNANTLIQHIGGATSPFYDAAYYYIDDVSVIQCDSLFSSVNEISSSSEVKNIRLYPNPSTGKLTIKTENLKIEKLEVYNFTGQRVFQIANPNHQATNEIDFSFLPKGVYLIRVYDNKVYYDKKIIIQ